MFYLFNKIKEFWTNIKIRHGLESILFSVIFIGLLLTPIIEDMSKSTFVSTQTFIGKDKFISMVNNFKYYVLKDKIFNGLIAGQNGWLMYTAENSLDDYQNYDLFTKHELQQAKTRLNYLCSSLTESGIKLIIVVPPNKNTIYPEYMPKEISILKNESRMDQIMNIWKDSNYCKMVDLRPIFFEAKKENQLYYSTDTHWTQFGALITSQVISKIMKDDFPSVKVRSITEYKLIPSFRRGDLTQAFFGNLNLEEKTVNIELNFPQTFSIRNYNSPTGINLGLPNFVITFSNDTSLPRAIVYHDSFFVFAYPYLSENFKEAFYFWSDEIDQELVQSKKPDYVIIEITERFLAKRIFNLPNPNPK